MQITFLKKQIKQQETYTEQVRDKTTSANNQVLILSLDLEVFKKKKNWSDNIFFFRLALIRCLAKIMTLGHLYVCCLSS